MDSAPDEHFLRADDVIDWQHPAVLRLAREIQGRSAVRDVVDVARRSFEFVRDEISHTVDQEGGPVTCRASEVLTQGTGFCYAKSHLLCGLLRANGIPAAICYQRLRLDDSGSTFCLHALNAVHLPDVGWYRMDARGNTSDITAAFDPPDELLAFEGNQPGERLFPQLLAAPLASVVNALRAHADWQQLSNGLPDAEDISTRPVSSAATVQSIPHQR